MPVAIEKPSSLFNDELLVKCYSDDSDSPVVMRCRVLVAVYSGIVQLISRM